MSFSRKKNGNYRFYPSSNTLENVTLNFRQIVFEKTQASLDRTDTERSVLPGIPESAICVQRFDDSLNSAIRITYRISLRSSSLREPRYPLLRVVLKFRNIYPSLSKERQKNWFSTKKYKGFKKRGQRWESGG
jgi:hypothetical protein